MNDQQVISKLHNTEYKTRNDAGKALRATETGFKCQGYNDSGDLTYINASGTLHAVIYERAVFSRRPLFGGILRFNLWIYG